MIYDDPMNQEERLCSCGNCRYCDTWSKGDDDYRTSEYLCETCNGGGCTKCEE